MTARMSMPVRGLCAVFCVPRETPLLMPPSACDRTQLSAYVPYVWTAPGCSSCRESPSHELAPHGHVM